MVRGRRRACRAAPFLTLHARRCARCSTPPREAGCRTLPATAWSRSTFGVFEHVLLRRKASRAQRGGSYRCRDAAITPQTPSRADATLARLAAAPCASRITDPVASRAISARSQPRASTAVLRSSAGSAAASSPPRIGTVRDRRRRSRCVPAPAPPTIARTSSASVRGDARRRCAARRSRRPASTPARPPPPRRVSSASWSIGAQPVEEGGPRSASSRRRVFGVLPRRASRGSRTRAPSLRRAQRGRRGDVGGGAGAARALCTAATARAARAAASASPTCVSRKRATWRLSCAGISRAPTRARRRPKRTRVRSTTFCWRVRAAALSSIAAAPHAVHHARSLAARRRLIGALPPPLPRAPRLGVGASTDAARRRRRSPRTGGAAPTGRPRAGARGERAAPLARTSGGRAAATSADTVRAVAVDAERAREDIRSATPAARAGGAAFSSVPRGCRRATARPARCESCRRADRALARRCRRPPALAPRRLHRRSPTRRARDSRSTVGPSRARMRAARDAPMASPKATARARPRARTPARARRAGVDVAPGRPRREREPTRRRRRRRHGSTSTPSRPRQLPWRSRRPPRAALGQRFSSKRDTSPRRESARAPHARASVELARWERGVFASEAVAAATAAASSFLRLGNSSQALRGRARAGVFAHPTALGRARP